MQLDRRKIYWVIGISSLIAGVLIGRYFYVKNSEVKEAEKNINPNVLDEITNGHTESLNNPLPDNPEEYYIEDTLQQEQIQQAEMMDGAGDY
jgi:hypothetical protein